MENILNKLAGLIASLTALIGGTFATIPPEAITPLDPMPDIIIQEIQEVPPLPELKEEHVAPAPTPKPANIPEENLTQLTYELAKTQGYAEGVADTLKANPTPSREERRERRLKEEEKSMATKKEKKTEEPKEEARTGASESNATPDKMVLESLGTQSLKGLYKVGEQVEVGVLIQDSEGNSIRDKEVTMTAGETTKKKDYANAKKGFKENYYYSFTFTPESAGEHTLEFSGAGLSESVTITVE